MLEEIKKFFEDNLNSYLTNIQVTTNTIKTEDVDLDNNTTPFLIILQLENESFDFETMNSTMGMALLKINIIIRKNKNAEVLVYEVVNAIRELCIVKYSLGNTITFIDIIKGEMGYVEAIDNSQARGYLLEANIEY